MTPQDKTALLDRRDRVVATRARIMEEFRLTLDLVRDQPGNEEVSDLLQRIIEHALRLAWLQAYFHSQLGFGHEYPPDLRLVPERSQRAGRKVGKRLSKKATPDWMQEMGVSL